MKGNPKYNYGDKVKFTFDGKQKEGSIYIIDKFGTFGDDSDVSYDVMVQNAEEYCLYKHIREDYLTSDE